MNNKVIITLLIFLSFSCAKKVIEEHYETGELSYKCDIDESGKKNGQGIKYYQNGQKIWECSYVNDKEEGFYIEYYINGQKKKEAKFKGGLQNGNYAEYLEDGKIKFSGQYINGKKEGEFLYYNTNGALDTKAMFKNDISIYYATYDSLGKIKDKKHRIALNLLSQLNTNDSIKIGLIAYGFISNPSTPLFISMERYGTIKEGEMPKMEFNKKDSSHYYTFPPQKEPGKYVIKTLFYSGNKFANHLDTIITISE
jgi:hypothetical protein